MLEDEEDWFIHNWDETLEIVTFPFAMSTRPAAKSDTTEKLMQELFTVRLFELYAINPVRTAESVMFTEIWALNTMKF